MLIDTLITAAFKNSLGQYDIKRLSVFEIANINKFFNNIECEKLKNKEIKIKIICPICGEYHHYVYNISDFIKRSMIIGGCEKIGLPLFFIGNTEKVEDKINKYKEVNRKIYAMI
ncbi:hypothetical protein [Clostridium sp. JNZ J1-5]